MVSRKKALKHNRCESILHILGEHDELNTLKGEQMKKKKLQTFLFWGLNLATLLWCFD